MIARPFSAPAAPLRGYAEAALLVALSTLVGLVLAPRWGNAAVDLIYLPAVLGAAMLAGLGPSLFAAIVSALCYNYFFTAPHLTFRIENPNDIVTVVVLLGVAALTSQLAASVRRQAHAAEADAARNATIASFARHLLSCTSEAEIADVSARELAGIFSCNAVLVGPKAQLLASAPAPTTLNPSDCAVAAMVLESGERAGRGAKCAVPTEWQFHPVSTRTSVVAALGLARDDGLPAAHRDQLQLLDSLLDQAALAFERGRLERQSQEFARVRERDQLRSVLLSTIGHDLSEPLGEITQAANALRREGAGDRTQLAAIGSQAAKVERYLADLTDLSADTDERPVELQSVTVDLFRRAVLRDGEEVHLTPKEFTVLAELVKHRGRVLTHAHLLRTAWGPAQERNIEYLRVAIRALRQKLEHDPAHPRLILNEPAVGYRLKVAAAAERLSARAEGEQEQR